MFNIPLEARHITPSKARELLNVISISKCNFQCASEPMYWPSDNNKVPKLFGVYTN